MENQNNDADNIHNVIERTYSIESIVSIGKKSKNTWRSNPFFHFVSKPKKKSCPSVLSSRNSTGSLKAEATNEKSNSVLSVVPIDLKMPNINGIRNSIVTIVLVEAKCLPLVPDDGTSHNLYCKFRLGNASYKSKAVAGSNKPEWRERFKLHLLKDDLLKISVWDKGKQKNFMGSCLLDLSSLEAERTHEIWQQLEDGYGLIHLSVTICSTSSNNSPSSCLFSLQDFQQRHAILNMNRNWELVGLLHVNVLGAKGFAGRPNAYCILELDNERLQTPQDKSTSEPCWNKCYVFNVYDVTSTLDLKVYDGSLLNESLGKVSIPLLRIADGQMRWYALKDKSKRHIAKGNCPRVCLQMNLMWNPIKASMRLFRPKPVKYVKKPPKFDIALVYSNLEFVRDVFNLLYRVNEYIKQLFEWDDAQFSFLALIGWLIFCSYLELWTVPLLLLLPFIYFCLASRYQDNRYRITRTDSNPSEAETNSDKNKEEKSLAGKLQGIQIMTLTITNGVEYTASVVERLFKAGRFRTSLTWLFSIFFLAILRSDIFLTAGLVSYKVPFLSILTMIILVISSFVLYFVPFNYLLMVLGIYKFTRKYLNPDRALNNDLLDFISRIPDNAILNDWKELSVPEPAQQAIQSSGKLARSVSSDCSDVATKN